MPKETSGALSELALFAGAGGGILGGKLLGWRTVCAVERDQYAASVLAQRQNDGLLEAFAIWDDVQTFDGRPWRGVVDVISGGFPCQDISAIGKGKGIAGERSGLWRHMARIISEAAPQIVFVENSPNLRTRGLDVVLSDLARMGFDAVWGVVGADAAGLQHQRKRIWILAHTASGAARLKTERQGRQNAVGRSADCRGGTKARGIGRGAEPARLVARVGRVADGFPFAVDRHRALGNAQAPAQAALAFEKLTAYI